MTSQATEGANFNAANDRRQTLSCGGMLWNIRVWNTPSFNWMDGTGWRWEVQFGGGKNKSGVTPISRAAAIKIAEQEIDRVVKDK